MIIVAVKCLAVVTLLAGFFLGATSYYQLLLHLAIWGAAIVVFVQAARAGKYIWMAFLAVATMFNPIMPIAISPNLLLTLNVLTAGLFMVSFQVLRPTPRMSLASITDRTPRAESL